ncbi:MAG: Smr/MutS family protein [Xanthomonadales bacterium]|nr:Smr/MutS family protein [Xanthomonadales bacterium]
MISNDDREIFQQEMGDVQPLRQDRVHHESKRPSTRPRQLQESEASVLDELRGELDWSSAETGEELNYLAPGLQHRILKRLRRGQYSVGAELDLHHMNEEAARSSILSFIQEARRRHITCVRIVHGKGLRSKSDGPVLKRLTDSLLRRHSDVLAFTSTPPHDGGTGAVYVLLKR